MPLSNRIWIITTNNPRFPGDLDGDGVVTSQERIASRFLNDDAQAVPAAETVTEEEVDAARAELTAQDSLLEAMGIGDDAAPDAGTVLTESLPTPAPTIGDIDGDGVRDPFHPVLNPGGHYDAPTPAPTIAPTEASLSNLPGGIEQADKDAMEITDGELIDVTTRREADAAADDNLPDLDSETINLVITGNEEISKDWDGENKNRKTAEELRIEQHAEEERKIALDALATVTQDNVYEIVAEYGDRTVIFEGREYKIKDLILDLRFTPKEKVVEGIQTLVESGHLTSEKAPDGPEVVIMYWPPMPVHGPSGDVVGGDELAKQFWDDKIAKAHADGKLVQVVDRPSDWESLQSAAETLIPPIGLVRTMHDISTNDLPIALPSQMDEYGRFLSGSALLGAGIVAGPFVLAPVARAGAAIFTRLSTGSIVKTGTVQSIKDGVATIVGNNGRTWTTSVNKLTREQLASPSAPWRSQVPAQGASTGNNPWYLANQGRVAAEEAARLDAIRLGRWAGTQRQASSSGGFDSGWTGPSGPTGGYYGSPVGPRGVALTPDEIAAAGRIATPTRAIVPDYSGLSPASTGGSTATLTSPSIMVAAQPQLNVLYRMLIAQRGAVKAAEHVQLRAQWQAQMSALQRQMTNAQARQQLQVLDDAFHHRYPQPAGIQRPASVIDDAIGAPRSVDDFILSKAAPGIAVPIGAETTTTSFKETQSGILVPSSTPEDILRGNTLSGVDSEVKGVTDTRVRDATDSRVAGDFGFGIVGVNQPIGTEKSKGDTTETVPEILPTQAVITDPIILPTVSPTTAVITDPVVLPTQAVITETEPIVLPTQAVITETEPIVLPTQAVITETEPIVLPTQAVITETEPIILPTQAVITETEPIILPTPVPIILPTPAPTPAPIILPTPVPTPAPVITTSVIVLPTQAVIVNERKESIVPPTTAPTPAATPAPTVAPRLPLKPRPRRRIKGGIILPDFGGPQPDADTDNVHPRTVTHTELVEESIDPNTGETVSRVISHSQPDVVERDDTPPELREYRIGNLAVTPDGQEVEAELVPQPEASDDPDAIKTQQLVRHTRDLDTGEHKTEQIPQEESESVVIPAPEDEGDTETIRTS